MKTTIIPFIAYSSPTIDWVSDTPYHPSIAVKLYPGSDRLFRPEDPRDRPYRCMKQRLKAYVRLHIRNELHDLGNRKKLSSTCTNAFPETLALARTREPNVPVSKHLLHTHQ